MEYYYEKPKAIIIKDEKPHGHWVKMSDAYGYYYACSECGEDLHREWRFDEKFDIFPKLKSIDKTRYCPHCGAKMDECEE